MQQITCKYLVYGREIGESLTPHLQGTIAFECNKRLSGVRKLVPRAHWEPTRRLQESVAYCKKDGNVYESGVMPLTKSECAKKESRKDGLLQGQASLKNCLPKHQDL